MSEGHFVRPLCGYRCTRHLPPGLKSLRHLLAVPAGWEAVAPRLEVLGNRSVRGEKALRVSWRLEPLHAPLPLARRLVGVLRSIIQVAVLSMFDTGQYLAHRSTIAPQLIRDDDSRDVCQSLEQLAEELLGRVRVSPALHQNIEHVPLLVHRTPEIMALTPNTEAHLI